MTAAPSPGAPLLAAALTMHAAGLCVLPAAEDGSKRPAVPWREYQHTRPDQAQLTAWFGDGRRHGLGIICGAISGGLELSEIEGRAVDAGALAELTELAGNSGLGDLWQKVVGGWSVRSPSGGLHLLYRLDGPVPGNMKLAATADHVTLAETRGEGGWVVTAPSAGPVHPTGGAWATLAGGPATIPVLTGDEREALHVLLAQLDQRPVSPPPSMFTAHSGNTTDGVSPGDDYAAKTTWTQLLEPAGWRQVFTRGQVTYWRRPGKNDGISATTGYGDGDWLYIFTSSTEFEPERTYTKLGAYAVLHHGGDHAAAAKALQTLGFGKRTERHLTVVTPPPAAGPQTAGATALAPVPSHPETAPAVTAVGGYTLTDVGNAQLFVATHGHRLRYVPERGQWLRWAGHRWAEDTAGEHVELVKATLLAAAQVADDDAVRKHMHRSLGRKGVEAMVALARTDPAVVAPAASLDAHPDLLCTPEGTVHLPTGELRAVEPAELHTKSTPVTPDASVPTPRWQAFLADTFGGDQVLIDYVQRLAGYSATGIVTAHVFPFLFGPIGGNGKSVLADVLITLLGDYATSAPGSFLTVGQTQHETEIARLHGARLVIASEVDQDARFAEAKVKNLTGGDRLTARFMRKDHFTFDPSHKLWLMANHQPKVTGGGNSFWRRLRQIDFKHTVPEDRKVEGLDKILVAEEGPGILAWIVAGARSFYAGGLADPASVLNATRRYADEEDELGRFVAERLHITEGDAAAHILLDTRVVRAAYTSWCHEEGVDEVSAAVFGRDLRGRFGVDQKRSNGRRFYVGLSLVADDDGPTFHQPASARLPYRQ